MAPSEPREIVAEPRDVEIDDGLSRGASRAESVLDDMLGRILTCSRDEAGEMVAEMRIFQPHEIARRLAARYEQLAESRERSRAVWVIGELCGVCGVAFLSRCARSSEANVRRLAASALGKALPVEGDEAEAAGTVMALAKEALQLLTHDEASQVRQYARNALDRLSSAPRPHE